MDSERLLFEKGCFLPSWIEFDSNEEKISTAYEYRRKDLPTLMSELEQIKLHLEDVRQRGWTLSKLLDFHNNGLVRE